MWAGCSKEVGRTTDYVLKPRVQLTSGDVAEPVEELRAYAFDADTAQWTVASYDDALQGVITRRDDPSQRRDDPVAVAERLVPAEGAAGTWFGMSLGVPSKLVVAVDPATRLYAFTQQPLVENLPELYVSILFRPWKEGNTYKEGNWIFRNDFYAPPVYLSCSVSPSVQPDEGADPQEIPSVKVYAYAADTTLWRIASYDDAVAGVITSKNDPDQQRLAPSFAAYKSDAGTYDMSVSERTLMIVVVDRTDRMYAYTKQEVDLEGEPRAFGIVFRPWRREWIALDGEWCVVDPSLDPAAAQTDNDR